MNVQKLLENMEHNALDARFQAMVEEFYRERADQITAEKEYKAAKAQLDVLLTKQQLDVLDQIETLYSHNRRYAASHGFQCGMYGACRHFFTGVGDEDGGFMSILCNDLFAMPKMKRHYESYSRSQLIQEQEKALEDALEEGQREHITSVGLAWDERIHNAALFGFYCGYQAAYSMIGSVEPLARGKNIGKLLTMEYCLGLIHSYYDTPPHADSLK